MGISAMRSSALALIALTAVGLAAPAQHSRAQGPPPVEMTIKEGPAVAGRWAGRTLMRVTYHNVSSKCITGIVVGFKFFNSQGRNVLRSMDSWVPAKPRGCFAPGRTWGGRKGRPLPFDAFGNPTTYKASVDLVVFKDGTRWGPQKLTALDNQVLGMISLIKFQHPGEK